MPTTTALKIVIGQNCLCSKRLIVAEILIKARIAQEHPLLIFEQLPKARTVTEGLLEFQHLIEGGRTFQFSELPDRLWATTGVRLPALESFKTLGLLRNTIQHFSAPNHPNLGLMATRFIFEVIDPFINERWGMFAVDHNEDHEPYVYFVAGLVKRGIRFLVSPGVIDHLEYTDLDWPNDAAYKADMTAALRAAGASL